MKKSAIIATLAVTALGSSTASAAPDAWTGWSTMTQVNEHGDQLVLTGLNLSPNPAACSGTGLARLDIANLTSAKEERIARIVLAAFLAGRQVALVLSGTTCDGGNPVFNSVAVR